MTCTPPEIKRYIHDIVKQAMNTEEYKTFEKERYMDVTPGYLNGEDFYKAAKEEVAHYETIAREVGLLK